MNLYIDSDGIYHGTQALAKASGLEWEPVEVPTDKAGLIAYLNNIARGNAHDDTIVEDEPATETQPEALSPPPPPPPPAAPTAITLLDVEEYIQGADAVRLATLSENVCYRINELAKGLR